MPASAWYLLPTKEVGINLLIDLGNFPDTSSLGAFAGR
jgi:hypothetical protein